MQQQTQATAMCIFSFEFIMHNRDNTGFQPAVPKQAAPLAADNFVSAIMLQAVFAFESLTLAAYFLSQ